MEKPKKEIISTLLGQNGVWAVALLLAVLLTALGLGIFFDIRLDRMEEKLPDLSMEVGGLPLSESGQKYILREYAGRIGIFVEDSETPKEILGVYVFTLPAADRDALKIGITVYGDANLRALIEDFTA